MRIIRSQRLIRAGLTEKRDKDKGRNKEEITVNSHLSTLNSQLSTLNYHGPIGIDMLKTADGHIHPCLEINFRMNMGILALLLEEQYGAGCTIQLTPRRPDGFEALVERGKLMIAYRRR